MKCPRCQHENPAGARFCIECAAPLTRACANCGTQLPAAAKFCPECAYPAGAPAGQPRFPSPEAYTPKHLAEKILTSKGALEGERKQVTVLFADMKGSMELLAYRDPEEARKILDPVLELMMEAVHRYEGTVNQVMGDGIMALFGAPVAHEDHAVRACYAALRMQEAAKRYADEARRVHDLDVQVRLGINSGDVVVRAIGSDLRVDYTAVGQTTHLAARMEQHARPGSILLTADTLRVVEGFFDVRRLGPLAIKGLEGPVEAYELLGAAPRRSRLQVAVARGLTRFVGRERELQALRRALDAAAAGAGQVVALVGEAGVGKSRLIWELTSTGLTRGWSTLEATAVAYGKATAYLPVVDLLRTHFKVEVGDPVQAVRDKVAAHVRGVDEALEDAIPALLALLGALPEDHSLHALDPPERRRRTVEALRRVFLSESAVQPVLLVLEDLHWVDSETQRLLNVLVESLPAARLLLIVSYRPVHEHGWASKTYYTQLRIDPLEPDSAGQLLRALVGDAPELQPLKRVLVERTEGNPFFLEEMARTLVEAGVLAGKPGAYRLARREAPLQVPPTVQAVIAARIDRLAPEDKQVLQSAAVFGKDVPVSLLRVITELPDEALGQSLSRLQAAEFLYEAHLFPEPEYTFKHPLTQEVAYATLLQERRKALHARVLDAIEALAPERAAEQPELLAHHALGGEVWEKAVDYLRESGARAYGRGALRKALDRYEQALGLLPRLGTDRRDLARAVDVRLDLHAPLFALGQIPRLSALHREAAEIAERLGDSPRLARVLSRLGLYAFLDAQYRQGIAYADRARAIAEVIRDAGLLVTTGYFLGVNHLALGDHLAAVRFLEGIVDGPEAFLARRLTGLSTSPYVLACGWLAGTFSLLGDFGRALAYGERSVEAARDSDHPYGQAIADTWRVIPLAHRGDFAEALPGAKGAVELCEEKELFGWLPLAYSLWGWVLAWSGRPEEGVPYVERAVTLFETVGLKTFLALRYVEQAEALLLAGRRDEARRAAERALEFARAGGERGNETWALHVLGEVAAAGGAEDADTAARYYLEACALAEALGMRPLLARCRLGLGALCRRTGRLEAAREYLGAAEAALRDMGMARWLAHAREELRALG